MLHPTSTYEFTVLAVSHGQFVVPIVHHWTTSVNVDTVALQYSNWPWHCDIFMNQLQIKHSPQRLCFG